MHQPGGAIAGTQVALERQRRQPGLVLADEVGGQEPRSQWQLGAVQHPCQPSAKSGDGKTGTGTTCARRGPRRSVPGGRSAGSEIHLASASL